VSGNDVTPAPTTIDARPGEVIALTLTSDRGGELHVHAADPETEVEIAPGTKTYTFTVTEQPGVYEVELHDPDLLLFEIKVQ
jgi:plastocyanin